MKRVEIEEVGGEEDIEENASCEYADGRFKNAEMCYNQAIQRQPHCAYLYVYRAKCKVALKDLIGADYDCCIAVCMDNKEYKGFQQRGDIRLQLCVPDLALDDFSKAYDLCYDNSQKKAIKKQMDCCKQIFEYGGGVVIEELQENTEHMQKLLFHQKNAEKEVITILKEIGMKCTYGEQFDQAVYMYSQCLKIDPYNISILLERALANFKTSNFADVLLDCDQILKADSKNTRALQYKIDAKKALGNYQVKL